LNKKNEMAIRTIAAEEITSTVKMLCIEANIVLGDDVLQAYEKALEKEESPLGRDILNQLLENARIAREEEVPLCQDTGLAVVFVEMGMDIHITGGDFNESIHEGIRTAYREGYFRVSSRDPITGEIFKDNIPAIIHLEMVPGNTLKLTVVPKGFGGENMSRVVFLPPAAGIEGIKKYVVQRVKESGPNPCPPLVVGVGIGANLEKVALIAKKALLRPLGQRHSEPRIARLEEELLEEINNLGIGPLGLGGRVTALDVHVETHPTHIGSLPVAVNIQCHSVRHKQGVI
jgi:fumarate hydratase subunit alpha